MPALLMDFGPGEALTLLVEDFRKNTGLTFHFVNELFPEGSQLNKEKGIALYRIAQEALHNAIKHAGASTIKMSVTEFDDHVDFFLSDDGQGFDLPSSNQGSGLRNIRERVLILGGTIHIDTGKKGTTIEVTLPTNDDQDYHSR
jgi:signal transduction histidine kinase